MCEVNECKQLSVQLEARHGGCCTGCWREFFKIDIWRRELFNKLPRTPSYDFIIILRRKLQETSAVSQNSHRTFLSVWIGFFYLSVLVRHFFYLASSLRFVVENGTQNGRNYKCPVIIYRNERIHLQQKTTDGRRRISEKSKRKQKKLRASLHWNAKLKWEKMCKIGNFFVAETRDKENLMYDLQSSPLPVSDCIIQFSIRVSVGAVPWLQLVELIKMIKSSEVWTHIAHTHTLHLIAFSIYCFLLWLWRR